MPKRERPRVEPPPVEHPKHPVYRFRRIGTDRTYDVDAKHVKVMVDRTDMEYIGDLPLPKF